MMYAPKEHITYHQRKCVQIAFIPAKLAQLTQHAVPVMLWKIELKVEPAAYPVQDFMKMELQSLQLVVQAASTVQIPLFVLLVVLAS